MPGFRAGPGRLVDATSSPGVASLLEHVLQPLPSTLPPSTAFPGSFMWVPAAGSGAPGTWQVPWLEGGVCILGVQPRARHLGGALVVPCEAPGGQRGG